VLILTNTSIKSKQYKFDCDEIVQYDSNIEFTGVKIKDGKKKAMIICAIYRPPNYKLEVVKQGIYSLGMIIKELIATKRQFLLCGDFNLKYDWSFSLLEQILRKHKLTQLITSPSRGDAMLDLIITNTPETCSNSNVTDVHVSDHMLISTELVHIRKERHKTCVSYRNYDKIFIEKLNSDLNTLDLRCYTEMNVETLSKRLHEAILNTFNKHAPYIQKSFTKKDQPLKISVSTKTLIKQRDYYRKLSQQHPVLLEKYRKLRKAVKRSITSDKRKSISDDINQKGFWPTINKILNDTKKTCNIPFPANDINHHFENISNCTKIRQLTIQRRVRNPINVFHSNLLRQRIFSLLGSKCKNQQVPQKMPTVYQIK